MCIAAAVRLLLPSTMSRLSECFVVDNDQKVWSSAAAFHAMEELASQTSLLRCFAEHTQMPMVQMRRMNWNGFSLQRLLPITEARSRSSSSFSFAPSASGYVRQSNAATRSARRVPPLHGRQLPNSKPFGRCRRRNIPIGGTWSTVVASVLPPQYTQKGHRSKMMLCARFFARLSLTASIFLVFAKLFFTFALSSRPTS